MSRAEKRRRIRRVRRNRRIAMLTGFVMCSVMLAMTFGRTHVTANQNSYKYYTDVTVEPEDSLWSIASDYYTEDCQDMNTYVNEIKSINGMVSDEVKYGDVLIIPYFSEELK